MADNPASKLTPKVVEVILTHLRGGNYIETAAAAAGINKDTLYTWLRRGGRERRGRYFEFTQAVNAAMAEAETADLKRIAVAAEKGQWQASAWRLERRYPHRWGLRQRVEQGESEAALEAARILSDAIARAAKETPHREYGEE